MTRFAPIVLTLAAFAMTACASVPDDSSAPRLAVVTASESSYTASVHPVVERRCGSGECHGNVARGLRVTRDAHDTYLSIMALEPERIDALGSKPDRSREDAVSLTLLSKPLTRERHRGGTALIAHEAAERCLVSWLLGSADADACAAAAR